MERAKDSLFLWNQVVADKDYRCLVTKHLLRVQKIVEGVWWWAIYDHHHDQVVSSYTDGVWCNDLESAQRMAEDGYSILQGKIKKKKMDCTHCETEFNLPQGNKRTKLFLSQDPVTLEEYYMCEDCYQTRLEVDGRYFDGVKLCFSKKCCRDAMEGNDYCEVCVNEKAFQ